LLLVGGHSWLTITKKAGVAEYLKAFRRAGLLVNEPPAIGKLLFYQSSDNCN
jgi:hypothetical protein